jgi:hypothetical protein
MANLIVVFAIWRRHGTFMNVAMGEQCAFANEVLEGQNLLL